MAKKSVMGDATDAIKSLAAAALGAAAAAATSVVAETVAGIMTEVGKKAGDPTPGMEKVAARTVAKPILPAKKRAAAKGKSKVAKKRVAAVRATKSKRAVKPRKKR